MKFENENMQAAYESLEALKEGKLAEIKGNKGHIVSLEDENNRLLNEIKGIEQALKQIEKLFDGKPEGETAATKPKYAQMPLGEAILDILADHGQHPGLLVPEIIEKLGEGGFQPAAKNPYSSVYSVAMSLLGQGKIKEGEKEGKRSFMRKNI